MAGVSDKIEHECDEQKSHGNYINKNEHLQSLNSGKIFLNSSKIFSNYDKGFSHCFEHYNIIVLSLIHI